MATVTLTREQAISSINGDINMRPCRIKKQLEEKGYKNVTTFGRGKNLLFVYEISEDTDEQCYHIFKDICINEYCYSKSFNYDKALEIIEYHINNKEFKSIKDIAEDLGMNESRIYRHRNKLCGKILKNTSECIKRTYAKNILTELQEDITELYDDIIIAAYNNTLNSIREKYPKSKSSEVAIFRNNKNKSFEIMTRERDTFQFLKESMEEVGNKFIASYPVWFNLHSNPVMNTHLKQKIFQLILNENGYDYVFFLRLYEITEDLKHDKELLNVITKAIKYMKNNNK